jgi:hypothetical protein
LLAASGFAAQVLTNRWVAKEITAIARLGAARVPMPADDHGRAELEAYLSWLSAGIAAATRLSEKAPIGVFGTAIGGTWLASVLGDAAAFFVDEDGARTGKVWLGRPVIAPSSVAAGVDIMVPLAPEIAAKVVRRLSDDRRRYHAFPPIPPSAP